MLCDAKINFFPDVSWYDLTLALVMLRFGSPATSSLTQAYLLYDLCSFKFGIRVRVPYLVNWSHLMWSPYSFPGHGTYHSRATGEFTTLDVRPSRNLQHCQPPGFWYLGAPDTQGGSAQTLECQWFFSLRSLCFYMSGTQPAVRCLVHQYWKHCAGISIWIS